MADPEPDRPDQRMVERALADLIGAEKLPPDMGLPLDLIPKLKPEHITTILELQRRALEQRHESRMAELKTRAEADAARLRADAEQVAAGPRFVLRITIAAFLFIPAVSAVFLGFNKPDLLPQIITAALGLVTGLAGGFGIGRATAPGNR